MALTREDPEIFQDFVLALELFGLLLELRDLVVLAGFRSAVPGECRISYFLVLACLTPERWFLDSELIRKVFDCHLSR